MVKHSHKTSDSPARGTTFLPRLTDTVWLQAAPRQVGEAGPGGGALQQVALLALEKDDAPHLSEETNP